MKSTQISKPSFPQTKANITLFDMNLFDTPTHMENPSTCSPLQPKIKENLKNTKAFNLGEI